jgi:hypothetical protein
MRPLRVLSVAVGLLAMVTSDGCKSRWRPDGMDAATSRPDGSGTGDAISDATSDAAGALAPCLDTPTDLPRPPAGRLPCELIPPGLRL